LVQTNPQGERQQLDWFAFQPTQHQLR
jgi:hypothetical protein